jgi:hypothetical protein
MIPRESIDAFRKFVNVTLSNYGISCDLYVPTTSSYNTAETLDVFAVPQDLSYDHFQAMVFVEWGVSAYRLKKLGVFTEDALPIVAWFSNVATAADGSDSGEEVPLDVHKKSYFTVEPEFIPDNYKGSESFEVVNPVIKGMHDAILLQGWLIAPRRVKK